jgi:Uma2 family endonuclease
MVVTPTEMTADELYRYDLPKKRTELVRGRLLVREPTGGPHASLLTELTIRIAAHVRATDPPLGRVLVGDPGFWIERAPDTVRAPDLAFIRREQLPGGRVPDGFFEGVPDLAVEIRSPSDRAGDLYEKLAQWLNAGVGLIWVIDPKRREAMQLDDRGTTTMLGASAPS